MAAENIKRSNGLLDFQKQKLLLHRLASSGNNTNTPFTSTFYLILSLEILLHNAKLSFHSLKLHAFLTNPFAKLFYPYSIIFNYQAYGAFPFVFQLLSNFGFINAAWIGNQKTWPQRIRTCRRWIHKEDHTSSLLLCRLCTGSTCGSYRDRGTSFHQAGSCKTWRHLSVKKENI